MNSWTHTFVLCFVQSCISADSCWLQNGHWMHLHEHCYNLCTCVSTILLWLLDLAGSHGHLFVSQWHFAHDCWVGCLVKVLAEVPTPHMDYDSSATYATCCMWLMISASTFLLQLHPHITHICFFLPNLCLANELFRHYVLK